MYRFLDGVGKYGTDRHGPDDCKIRHLGFPCLLHKARYIHAEYVQRFAFPCQQYLHYRTTILWLFEHCPSCFVFVLTIRAVDLH